MKITATKIKRMLVEQYGWEKKFINSTENQWYVDELIKDTLKAIDTILKANKGISIRK